MTSQSWLSIQFFWLDLAHLHILLCKATNMLNAIYASPNVNREMKFSYFFLGKQQIIFE